MPLRKSIWNGRIPLRIVLDSNETREQVDREYYVSAFRISYLPLYLKEALAFFRPYLIDPSKEAEPAWWFEFEGVPVKWNWPIGLSFDLLSGLDPANDNEDERLPWTLRLRYKDYPHEYVVALEMWETVMDNWLNQSKESCVIRDGNANAIMSLSKSDTTDLWSSVEKHSFDKFWQTMDKLLPSVGSYRNIPVKLYFPMSNNVRQALVGPGTGEGPQTVGSALHHHLPDLFPSSRRCVIARPLMHGTIIPMDAPLTELLPQCMYLDGFLHISIIMMS